MRMSRTHQSNLKKSIIQSKKFIPDKLLVKINRGKKSGYNHHYNTVRYAYIKQLTEAVLIAKRSWGTVSQVRSKFQIVQRTQRPCWHQVTEFRSQSTRKVQWVNWTEIGEYNQAHHDKIVSSSENKRWQNCFKQWTQTLSEKKSHFTNDVQNCTFWIYKKQ